MVHPSQQGPKYRARKPSWSLTLRRGSAAKTFAVRPYVAVPVIGAVTLLLTAYVGATGYLVYRDDLVGAAVSRQVSMQYAYEERIAALRSELDRLSSRHAVQTEGVEQQVSRLLDQQATIEERQTALDGILRRAQSAGVEVGTASAPTPQNLDDAADSDGPADSVGGEIAPLSYMPSGGPSDEIANVLLKSKAAGTSPTPNVRPLLATLRSSLDDTEHDLSTTLDALSVAAAEKTEGIAAALAPIGIRSGEEEAEPEGGPFIPATGLHFVEKAALLNRTLDELDGLRAQAASLPVAAPVKATRVSSRFGNRLDPFLKRPAFHAGLDFVAPAGSTVYATAPGTVVSAGWNGGYGNMVEIRHANGLSTRYGHLSRVLVAPGAKVAAGTPIGRVGTTGRSTGPHLHYETRRGDDAVNPAPFLAAGKALRSSS